MLTPSTPFLSHIFPSAHHTLPTEDGFGERALWAAVITQALMDAASQSKKPEAIKAKEEALEWLKGDCQRFEEVCEMAGYCPDYVREMAKQALARQCRWRNTSRPQRSTATPAAMRASKTGEKRRRGRPKKHSLPLSHHATNH